MLKLKENAGVKYLEGNLNCVFGGRGLFVRTEKADFIGFLNVALELSGREKEEKEEDFNKSVAKFDSILSCDIKDYDNYNNFQSFNTIEGLNYVLKDIDILYLGGYYLDSTILIGDKQGNIEKVYRFESSWNCEDLRVIEVEDTEGLIMEYGKREVAYNYNGNTIFKAHNIWCSVYRFDDADYFEDNDKFYDFYNICDYCGEIYDVDDSDLHYIDRLGVVCRECAENHGFIECEDTGEWVDGPYQGRCECCCCGCEDCPYYQGYEEEEEYNKIGDDELNPLVDMRKCYGKTYPVGLYKGRDYVDFESDTADFCRKKGVYFGLEIESKIYNIRNVDSIRFIEDSIYKGLFEAKEDCTISKDSDAEGFEFVSKHLFNIFDSVSLFKLKDFIVNVKEAGFIADSDCGGHIHLDRKSIFTSEDFVKMAYKIENTNEDDLENLFGRGFNEWCGRLGRGCWANAVSKAEAGVDWDIVLEGLNYGSHGYFLNVSRNTVEFRLFAGSVNFRTFMRYLQVLLVLKETVKGKSFEDLEEGWTDEDYAELDEKMLKLKEVGLING